jgi:membrane-bound lytic murein transglycosylase D
MLADRFRLLWATRGALVVCLLLGASVMFPTASEAGMEVAFPRPAAIEPNVDFWVKVFTQYSYRDFIVHDRDNLQIVYQVMHLPGEGAPSRSEIEWTSAYLKAKYSDILNRLASGKSPANFEERQVAAMFKGKPPSAYTLAANNLRVQEGLKERFREGLLRSRYYRPTMERIFRQAGIPVELVTLAEVESGFYPGARSSAGAVGIWQFTRATGKQYMTITRYHDDRLNPVRSTEAAAQLLRYNYQVLGSWPLAITAYNYGTGGMARAANNYAHNYARILANFDGPHFGFAAKNYYPEFLAALEVHQHEERYFPGIQYESVPPPPQPRTNFRPPVAEAHHRVNRHSHRVSRHRSKSRTASSHHRTSDSRTAMR